MGKAKGKRFLFLSLQAWNYGPCVPLLLSPPLVTGAALTKLENHLKVEIFDETDQAFMDVDEWEGIFSTSFKGLKIGARN